jgi:hypothetical protein
MRRSSENNLNLYVLTSGVFHTYPMNILFELILSLLQFMKNLLWVSSGLDVLARNRGYQNFWSLHRKQGCAPTNVRNNEKIKHLKSHRLYSCLFRLAPQPSRRRLEGLIIGCRGSVLQ